MGMARLIDAKVLERQIKATFKDSNPVLMGQMLRWVRCQTTIDAVPVIRCKDCRFYNKDTVSCSFVTADANWYEDDFCSYGERKTENT
jgi:hypothetical protein